MVSGWGDGVGPGWGVGAGPGEGSGSLGGVGGAGTGSGVVTGPSGPGAGMVIVRSFLSGGRSDTSAGTLASSPARRARAYTSGMLSYAGSLAMTSGTTSTGGFSWANLGILLLVVAVVWLFLGRLRRRVSRDRMQRWERQGLLDAGRENDPDLRRDADG